VQYINHNDKENYLVGQNCTSSTVSSCPLNVPLGPTDGLLAFPSFPSPALDADLMLPPVAGDFAEFASVASVEI